MAHKLLLATRNKGKIEEFRRILDAVAPGEIDLVGLDQFPDLHDVIEDGATFEENALKKAREMSLAAGIPAIADDSGLCVDALNGDPGIFSARWAGDHSQAPAAGAHSADGGGDCADRGRGTVRSDGPRVCCAGAPLAAHRRWGGLRLRDPRGAIGAMARVRREGVVR